MIIAFNIPDDPAEMRSWLDQQLVGIQLGQFVDELTSLARVMHEPSQDPSGQNPNSAVLAEILNDDLRERVLQQGTSVLDDAQIHALFRSPDTLLELQEDILINGGKYWQTVPRTPEHIRLAQVDFRELEAKIRSAAPIEKDSAENELKPLPAEKPGPAKRWSFRVIGAGLLTLSLLVTLAILRPTGELQASGTGFGTPGLFNNDVGSQTEYLQRMSKANEKWLQTARSDAEALLSALRDYSTDCQIVINSRHPALDDTYERWLKAKCDEWKGKIDEIIAGLESGRLNFQDAKIRVDDVVGKLVTKLHNGPTEDELRPFQQLAARGSMDTVT